MSARKTILQGTLILTAVGFLCRFMGFFYRIFLSHTFGEENVGLYQLTFPVFAPLHLIYIRRIRDRHFQNRSQKTIPPSTRERLCRHFVSDFLFMPALLWSTMIILQKTQPISRLRCSAIHVWRDPDSLILRFAAFFYSWLYHGVLLWFKTDTDTCRFTVDRADCRILSVFCLYRFAIRNGLHADISIRSCGNCIRRTVFYLLFLSEDFKRADLIFSARDFLSLL